MLLTKRNSLGGFSFIAFVNINFSGTNKATAMSYLIGTHHDGLHPCSEHVHYESL